MTSLRENLPLPDLLIAKAPALARQIRFGTGVVCLPPHHPALVAPRIARLDRLARGRFYFGSGAGGVPTAMELFGIDYRSGVRPPWNVAPRTALVRKGGERRRWRP